MYLGSTVVVSLKLSLSGLEDTGITHNRRVSCHRIAFMWRNVSGRKQDHDSNKLVLAVQIRQFHMFPPMNHNSEEGNFLKKSALTFKQNNSSSSEV